jgi:hypothetical protein
MFHLVTESHIGLQIVYQQKLTIPKSFGLTLEEIANSWYKPEFRQSIRDNEKAIIDEYDQAIIANTKQALKGTKRV